MDTLDYGLIIGTAAYFIGGIAFFFNFAKTHKLTRIESLSIYFIVGLLLDYIINNKHDLGFKKGVWL